MPKRDLVRRTNQLPAGYLVGPGGVIVLGGGSGGDADSVDGFHASAEPQPGMLLPLGPDGRFPASALDLSGIAGDGLIFSGDALHVGAGTGIVVGENAVALDAAADLVWTGNHTHRGLLTTRHILPESTDTYDLGSSTRLWRKGWLSELDAVVFAEQTAALVGGWLIVPHGSGSLAADVAADDTVVDFGQAMTVGDFICLRSSAPAVEYMQVGEPVAGTVYNVTRDLDGSGANDWPAGTAYLILGQAGDGRIELDAQTGGPRVSVLLQGDTYNAQSEVVRIGDLDGSFGVASECYGFAAGDYAAGNYLRYEPDGGFLLSGGGGTVAIDGTGILVGYDAANGLRFAADEDGTIHDRIYHAADANALHIQSGTQYWEVAESGGAKLAMDGGFLKLQPRSGATTAHFAMGDAPYNWAMLSASLTPSSVYGLGIHLLSGSTTVLQGYEVPQPRPQTWPPHYVRVSVDLGPGTAYYITPIAQFVWLSLGAFDVTTGARYGHLVGELAFDPGGWPEIRFTNSPNALYDPSVGDLSAIFSPVYTSVYLYNRSSHTLRVIGWAVFTY